jgi:hypothetical protein
MLRRFWPHLIIVALFAIGLNGAISALAQDNGDGVRVAVVSAPTYIAVPKGEPLVLWVRSVEDDIASAVVLVENADGGYTQLTPCDNIEVICEDAAIPAQGTQDGDTFFLRSE